MTEGLGVNKLCKEVEEERSATTRPDLPLDCQVVPLLIRDSQIEECGVSRRRVVAEWALSLFPACGVCEFSLPLAATDSKIDVLVIVVALQIGTEEAEVTCVDTHGKISREFLSIRKSCFFFTIFVLLLLD